MIIRSCIIASTLFLCVLSHGCELPAPHEDIEQDPLFNTKLITDNRNEVQKHLMTHYNASIIDIATDDNVTLKAISIPATETVERTIIAFPGFYRGVKEGMVPLIRLLPKNYHKFLVEERGHGESDGYFWSNLRRYGIDETNDIKAALEWVKKHTSPTIPVTILGLCTGGFNATRALQHLKNENKLHEYNVDSLILDSTIVSGTHVLHAGKHHFQKVMSQYFAWLYPNDSNAQVRERLLPKLVWYLLGSPIISALTFFVRGGIEKHDPETRIDTNIQSISDTPILALHAEEDGYAPKDHVEHLIKDHRNPQDEVHIFKDSSHANNFLKHKVRYGKIVKNFLAKIKAAQNRE